MIIENELLHLFLIEIHANLQRICTAKKHANSTDGLIFSPIFWTASISGIDLYLEIFKVPVKCLNFIKDPLIQWAHHTFLKSRCPEDTKNSSQVLSKKGVENYNSFHGWCQWKHALGIITWMEHLSWFS